MVADTFAQGMDVIEIFVELALASSFRFCTEVKIKIATSASTSKNQEHVRGQRNYEFSTASRLIR